jgi:hypothetical protein
MFRDGPSVVLAGRFGASDGLWAGRWPSCRVGRAPASSGPGRGGFVGARGVSVGQPGADRARRQSNAPVIIWVQGQCRAEKTAAAGGDEVGCEEQPQQHAFGLPSAGPTGEGEHGRPGAEIERDLDDLQQIRFCAVDFSGRLRRPLSRAARMRHAGRHRGCRPARGQTDTRIGTDTLLHLRSAAFSTTVRTLDEPYCPRSAALLSSWVTSRATSLVKARGQLPACLPPDARQQ